MLINLGIYLILFASFITQLIFIYKWGIQLLLSRILKKKKKFQQRTEEIEISPLNLFNLQNSIIT